MAMYLHSILWEDKRNRTFAFSSLVFLLAFSLEAYLLFYPEDSIRMNLDFIYYAIDFPELSILGTSIFEAMIVYPLLGFVHFLLWAVLSFFLVLFYALIKEEITLPPIQIMEFLVIGATLVVFIFFVHGIYFAIVFTAFYLLEFVYFFFALIEE